jgi:hypothetical protein
MRNKDPELLGTLYQVCRDCGEIFCIEPQEQKWLLDRHLEIFSRCRSCRKKRREAQGLTGSFAPPGEKKRPW